MGLAREAWVGCLSDSHHLCRRLALHEVVKPPGQELREQVGVLVQTAQASMAGRRGGREGKPRW